MLSKTLSVFVCSLLLFSAMFILINAEVVGRTDDTRDRISGIAFYQVDYDYPDKKTTDSDTGMIELDVNTLKQATRLESGFVNGYTSSGWVIRNMPFFAEQRSVKKSTYFDLGSNGDVRSLSIYIEVTEKFLERFSRGTMVTYTVSRTSYYIEGAEEPMRDPIFKAPDISMLKFDSSLFNLTYWQPNHEPANNIESAVAQCVPAAFANNLGYLEDTFGITMPHTNKLGLGNHTDNWMIPNDAIVSHLDIEMWRDDVQTRLIGGGTGTNGSVKGLLDYCNDFSLPIDLKHQGVRGDEDFERDGKYSIGMGDVDWTWVVNEIKYGHAVAIRYWRFANGEHYGGHQVTIERAGWIGGIPYVEIVHDSQQSTDLAGTVLQTSYLGINATNGNYTLLGVPEAVDGPVHIVRAVSMDPLNQAPAKPATPMGWVYIQSATPYEYQTWSSDPEGHDIYFQFDWDDGTYSGWKGAYGDGDMAGAYHSWSNGFHDIKVRARDQFWATSPWSDTLHIVVGIFELDDSLDIFITEDLPQAKTGEIKIDKELDKVLGHLRKSLDGDLWLDGQHIDPDQGHRVFSEHKAAVQKLQELLRQKDLPDATREVCWEIANKLALIDGQLAKTMIEEAQRSGGSGKQSARELSQAEDKFSRGLDEYIDGNPGSAIDNYRQAWEHALKA